MPDVSLEKLLPYVMPQVPGCPRDLALHEIRNAVREWCDDTHAWVEHIDSFYVKKDVNTYDLAGLTGRTIVAIASVERADNARSVGHSFSPTERAVTLHSPPVGALVNVYASLKPAMDAEQVAAQIIEGYTEALAHGAKARLMVMPGVEWSNPELSQYCAARFREGVIEGRVRRARRHSEQPMRAQPQRFI